MSKAGNLVILEYFEVPNALRTTYHTPEDSQRGFYWRCCASRLKLHPKPYCY
jgi:hypothetical protein